MWRSNLNFIDKNSILNLMSYLMSILIPGSERKQKNQKNSRDNLNYSILDHNWVLGVIQFGVKWNLLAMNIK